MRDQYVDHPGLPLCSRLLVEWHWFWFRWVWGAVTTRPRGLARGDLFMKSRGANYLTVWVGPLCITMRRPWLRGPAMSLHPELFKE